MERNEKLRFKRSCSPSSHFLILSLSDNMLKDFPFYPQYDEMDCGASCIRMIARHYGRFYSMEYLRELAYVDKEGVSLLSISDAAEYIGFHTLAATITYEQLQREVPLPCVAHWEHGHFVVVYKVTSKNVWLADPAHGKVVLARDEFLKKWVERKQEDTEVGTVLLLETTPTFFEREGQQPKRGGLRYLWQYFRNYKKLIRQLILGLFITSIIALVFPFLMEALIDSGVLENEPDLIVMILIAQLVLFGSQMFIEVIRSWILLHIGSRVSISLVSDFLIKLMRLPVRFFDTRHTSDILQRIYDNQRVEHFLSSTTLVSFFSAFNFIVFGFVLWYYDRTIFWIFLAATVLYIAWIIFFLRWRRDVDYRRFQQFAANQTSMLQLVQGMKEIKLHNAEKQLRWTWERVQAQLFRVSVDYLRINQIQRIGAAFINEGKNILITVVAATAVVENSMTLGQLVAIQYIVGQMNAPLNQFIQFIRAGQDAMISIDRMNEIHLMDDEEELEEKMNIIPEYGDLELEQVSFQYGGPHSPMILKNISLRIPKGKTTAIVGTSGSGKTTLLKLLLSFYKPTVGRVLLGDISLANIQSRIWRSKVGAVMQDEFIFSDTIAKNIALGAAIVDKQKLLKAVKVANIQSFVESLPLGYNTPIGQDGIGLSRGQRQRILIARAVYKNPDYIFFDEATNAMDAYQEILIMANLEEFFRDKTVVVVAHRLSTVVNADHVVVLEKGEIVEEGKHEDLVAKRGAYYYLIRNQLELGS